MDLRPLLALGLSMVAVAARADAPDARSVSLAEARARAGRLGPDVVLAQLREAVARADVQMAGTLPNPTLSVQTARLTARLTTGVALPLPLFGQRGAAVAAARADAQTATLDTEALRLEARWNATHAWLDLWEAQERARLAGTAAADTARLANVAQERFAAGSAPRLDAVRTTADRARTRAEAQAAGTAVAAAAARLGTWLGLDEPGVLRAAGTPALGPLPADGALEPRLAQHPSLTRDRAQVAAAAAHVKAEQRQRWPVVTAQVAASQADPTTPGTDVVGGLSFEAPVLSQRQGAIARARAEQALAEVTLELEARRLRAQLADASRQAEGAGLRARALAADVLPALEEARRMTEEGYRDGRVDLLRVLETQRALLEGRTAYLDAQATWQRALADVERALGASLDQGAGHAP